MDIAKPALGLAAVPGRRARTLELARDIEQRGYAGIYCPSIGDGMALCEALALVTEHIPFGTAIAPIYFRQPQDYAQTASFIHEVSGGRFRFGIGVAHAPSLAPPCECTQSNPAAARWQAAARTTPQAPRCP